MKARAIKSHEGFLTLQSTPESCTHIRINLPCIVNGEPLGELTLPVIIKGDRKGTNNWSWNGSLEKPTLKPSLLIGVPPNQVHIFVTDGQVIYLEDNAPEVAGSVVDLIDFTD